MMSDTVATTIKILDGLELAEWGGPLTAKEAGTLTVKAPKRLAEEQAEERRHAAEIRWMRVMKEIRKQAEAGERSVKWSIANCLISREEVAATVDRLIEFGYASTLTNEGHYWITNISWAYFASSAFQGKRGDV